MNRVKKTSIMFAEGWKQAINFLSYEENWTPLLVYVHVSRLLIGFAFGAIFATSLATLLCR